MDQWEQKMQQVRVSKQDMNGLIMNFLVTEVSFPSPTREQYGFIAFCQLMR
jgi:hypothetical protein